MALRLNDFDFTGMCPASPVDECDWCDVDRCNKCNEKLNGLVYFADDEVLCEICLKERGESILAEANAFARTHCEITGTLEVFDPATRDAPTPREYAAGLREAYTENSVRAFNRHARTNYDELIKDLDRDGFEDRIFYAAIRYRIDQLIGWEDEYNCHGEDDEGL